MASLLQDLDPSSAIVGAVIIGAGALWKLYFHLKKDQRDDASSTTQHKAQDSLWSNQSSEIDRLYEMLREMGDKLDEEISKRRTAERENDQLSARLQRAEARIAELEGKQNGH